MWWSLKKEVRNVNKTSMAADPEVCHEVVLGTYEEFLVGFKLLKDDSDSYKFHPSFSNHAHIQSIRCIAFNGKYLASGSTDESIQLFNMKNRQQHGCLQQHNGSVTGLQFFRDHLLSCSEDSTIAVWSSKNWECKKTLKGHKKAVSYLAIHPSGKMALSIAKDKTLRTWNLLKGQCSFVINLSKEADFVHWSSNGTNFILGYSKIVDVYSIENGTVIHKIELERNVQAATFLSETVFAVGDDSGDIHLYEINDKIKSQKFKAHSNRIKGLQSVSSEDDNTALLFTASSDGFLKAWKVDLTQWSSSESLLICEVDTTCRITCLTVLENQPV